jgi:hypothetical protein
LNGPRDERKRPAQLLHLHREPIDGRAAILSHWTRLFAEYYPGAWGTGPQTVEVHGDCACVLSVYSETLVDSRGRPSLVVRAVSSFHAS